MEWSRVLFSDEAIVSLIGVDRRRRAKRRSGEHNANVCFEEIGEDGGGSVMFWVGITSKDRGFLNAQ